MLQKKTAKQVQEERNAHACTLDGRKLSYNQQQELYFESIGVFKTNTKRRNERYDADIKYIQSISMDDVLDNWKDKIASVIEQHNDVNVKKNARYKTKMIKIIFDFKEQQKLHDEALEKMLFMLGE